MAEEPKPPTLWQTLASVGASFFGVQNWKNRERDFKHGKATHFIVMGVVATAVFVLLGLVAGPAAGSGAPAPQADRVVIEKAERRLTLYAGARRLASFFVALGQEPVGPKRCRGDNRTPEGLYQVSGRKADSEFHRALRLSYPSEADIERARARGCDPGGDIMIHGLRGDWGRHSRLHLLRDWTLGCVAVTNEEIERIWQMVADGVAVEIRP